jgi:DNA-binding transcriptional ArsR family regulator
MPISESEFGKSNRSPTSLLLEFLSFNYRNAYTLDEIADAMSEQDKNLSKQNLEKLLDALEYGGHVKTRVVDGKTYYKYSEIGGLKLI